MTGDASQPTRTTASPPGAPLFRRSHCFWLLVLVEVSLLVYIGTHCYFTSHQRFHLKAIWTSRRGDEIGAQTTRLQFEKLIAELMHVAKTNVPAAALAAKFEVKPQ